MVIGANSIAIYVMSWTMEHFVSESLQIHLGSAPFLLFGTPFEPVLRGIGVLLVFWAILYWMYRKKIFIKI
jgi:predicted acyltransferase